MIPSLENTILSRLLDDQGGGGLIDLVGPRITNIQGSQNTLTFPYIVFQVTGTSPQDTFTADGLQASFDVHVFDKVSSSNAVCNAILARLRGDAVQQPDRVPTYGLHRWTPGALGSSGWTAGTCLIQSESAQHDLNILHYVVTCTVNAQNGT